ncbi:hypothetical protein ABIF90_008431 [Bradyrhizobium japonicum]
MDFNRGGKMSPQHEKDLSQPHGDKLLHRSGNGDAWFLAKDPATGMDVIKHVSNAQTGGHISRSDVPSFLAGGANGPEHQALRTLLERGLASILIAYDIHPATGPAYDNLVQAIQSMGAWWHHLETVWIVRSDKTPEEIRDVLKVYVGADDQLLVLDISGDRAGWVGVSDAGSRWLKDNITFLTN